MKALVKPLIISFYFTTQGLNAQQLNPGVKIPRDIDIGVNQNLQIRDYIKKNKLQLNFPVVAKPRSASLSVGAVPWDSWCRNNPTGSTEGRISVQVRFPRRADSTSVLAVLVVHAGGRNYRTNVALGVGNFGVTSSTFPLPASEFCSDRCVAYHLEARNSADASKIDSRERQACF